MTEEEKKVIAREKHPRRVAQGHKLAQLMKKREKKKYCAAKNSVQNSIQYCQMILISMALAYLLYLPLTFVYFLYITFFSLKIKNLSLKNRINHQKDVTCFRKIYNK